MKHWEDKGTVTRTIYIQLGEWHVNHPQKAKQDSILAHLMNSNLSQSIEHSQERQES